MGRKIPITPEQEALPISKYYHREPAPIPAEKLALLAKGPCDPGCALDIHHRNDLFLSGYLPVETGYCVLEDGTGFVANHPAMPGVTAEMFDWWFAWHGCGPPALYHMGPGGPHRRRVPQLWTGPLRRPVHEGALLGHHPHHPGGHRHGRRRALCQLPGTPRAGL